MLIIDKIHVDRPVEETKCTQ